MVARRVSKGELHKDVFCRISLAYASGYLRYRTATFPSNLLKNPICPA